MILQFNDFEDLELIDGAIKYGEAVVAREPEGVTESIDVSMLFIHRALQRLTGCQMSRVGGVRGCPDFQTAGSTKIQRVQHALRAGNNVGPGAHQNSR